MSRGTATAPPTPAGLADDAGSALRVMIVSQQRSHAPPLGTRGAPRLRRDGHEVLHPSTFDSPWSWQIAAATTTKVLERVHQPSAARWHRWWHRSLLDRSVERVTAGLDPHGAPVVYYAQCPQSARAALRANGRERCLSAFSNHQVVPLLVGFFRHALRARSKR